MYATGADSSTPPLRLPVLLDMKSEARKIVAATAYDATFGALLDRNQVDLILVGDSLGMVVEGRANTLSVSVETMLYHTRATARGVKRALLVADMPFGSFPDPASSFRHAARLVGEGGASMVKLEGAGYVLDSIHYLAERDIPVCAHLGLTPQSVHRLGGFKVQGRGQDAAETIRQAASAVAAAGASVLVLECIPASLAAEITRSLPIPTIGIGAGPDCDGQILVCYDLFGFGNGRRPRFVKNFLSGAASADAAVADYVVAVRSGAFPAPEHCY